MNSSFLTKYGLLNNISFYETHKNGSLKSCIINEKAEIETPYGILIPQYEDGGLRRKNFSSISFYDNGMIKNISLQNQTKITTKYGIFPAEYIAFYDTGEIKRIFPLNGRLSAYWDEEDERELAEDMFFRLACGEFKNKVIGFYFYKSGNIKSITLWPKEKAKISTSQGMLPVRIGFSLYENGAVKSLEPQIPINISTPIGEIKAYDNAASGLNGDLNSLCFYDNGDIKFLTTASNAVKVLYKNKIVHSLKPKLSPSILGDDTMEIIPLLIEFSHNHVTFSKDISLEINKYSFIIERCTFNIKSGCSSCSSCGGCS